MNRLTISTLALAASIGLVACEKTDPPAPRTTSTPAADNTARNTPDRRPSETTTPAEDQGMSAEDTRITADIRKAIMADSAMSMNAQNCKIVTNKGAVTLRGPVNTQAEKDAIESKAKAIAGVSSVSNQLEVVVK